MAKKRPPGLTYTGGQWVIDKRVPGHGRLHERTGIRDERAEAEAIAYLNRKLAEIQGAQERERNGIYTFRQAATRYLRTETKRSLERDAYGLAAADPYIGHLQLEQVHMGTLQPLIDARREQGMKSSTVTRELTVIRRVLTLAARQYRDEQGRPWLKQAVPMFTMPDWEDAAQPYPLNWEEQKRFFQELPGHLAAMALFGVNTGLREQEICWLRWDWEVKVPELGASVFITPGKPMVYPDGKWPGEKNKEDQIVVLNRVARSVIDGQMGKHPVYVFPYEGRRLSTMYRSSWITAWRKAGLPTDRDVCRGPHNLKHTFGRRLAAAGVPMDIRKALLHHTTGDVTLHYSPADIGRLLEAAEKVTQPDREWTVLRRVR
jgi:integrase